MERNYRSAQYSMQTAAMMFCIAALLLTQSGCLTQLGGTVGSIGGTGVGVVAGTFRGHPIEGAAEGAKSGLVGGALVGKVADSVILSPITATRKLLGHDKKESAGPITGLTTDDVIRMKEEGVSDDEVINRIARNGVREERISPSVIRDLVDHNIGNRIVVAMQQSKNGQPVDVPNPSRDLFEGATSRPPARAIPTQPNYPMSPNNMMNHQAPRNDMSHNNMPYSNTPYNDTTGYNADAVQRDFAPDYQVMPPQESTIASSDGEYYIDEENMLYGGPNNRPAAYPSVAPAGNVDPTMLSHGQVVPRIEPQYQQQSQQSQQSQYRPSPPPASYQSQPPQYEPQQQFSYQPQLPPQQPYQSQPPQSPYREPYPQQSNQRPTYMQY